MIKLDVSRCSRIDMVSNSGKVKVIWVRWQETEEKTLQVVDKATDDAYYDRPSSHPDQYTIIDTDKFKYQYYFFGLIYYFQEVPTSKKLRECIK